MRLLSKQSHSETVTTGQFSDGSDRSAAVVTRWQVRVLDNIGRTVDLEFDHDPTDAELLSAVPELLELAPATRAGFERGLLQARFDNWWRWKQTRLEASARGAGAQIVTALTAREDAAWQAYLQALQAWRAAP